MELEEVVKCYELPNLLRQSISQTLIRRWVLLGNSTFCRSRHRFRIQDKVPQGWGSSNIRQRVRVRLNQQGCLRLLLRKVINTTCPTCHLPTSILYWWVICFKLIPVHLFTTIQIRIAIEIIIPPILRIKNKDNSRYWSRVVRSSVLVEKDQTENRRTRGHHSIKRCFLTHHNNNSLRSCKSLSIIRLHNLPLL